MNLSSKKKLVYPLIGILLFIITGLGIFFYINKLLNTPISIKDIKIDSKAALKLSLLEQISKKNGITEWELKATSFTLMKNEDKAVLIDVNVVFYTKEKTKVYLTSEEGILNTSTHDMTFLKNVIVRHETSTLRTDKLHYEKKPHILYSDLSVILEDKDSVLEADSMRTELNKNRTILKGHVKGKFSENFDIP
jgi:LPS export ABC transporter protein LptC